MKKLTEKEWTELGQQQLRRDVVLGIDRGGLSQAIVSELYGISRSTLWRWRKRYKRFGEAGLSPLPRSTRRRRITPETEAEILKIRRERGYGPQRIQLYLKRFHGLVVSSCTVWNVLRRNKMPALYMTRYNKPAKIAWRRYVKSHPGETIQIDVKFIRNPSAGGRKLYQFTAVDDCTRYRVIRIYSRNTTRSAIDFFETVKQVFPAKIREVQTDNGPEFSTDFGFHLVRQGVRHRLIRPRTPRLNGKVERSHRTDEQEFYSRQKFTDQEDLKAKLADWEKHYNLERGHMALGGQTPAEVLSSKLSTDSQDGKGALQSD
jgi:transposase InsO family protein